MALYRSPDFNVFPISYHGNQTSAWISILNKNVLFVRGSPATILKPSSNQPLLKCEYFEKYVVKLAENSHEV